MSDVKPVWLEDWSDTCMGENEDGYPMLNVRVDTKTRERWAPYFQIDFDEEHQGRAKVAAEGPRMLRMLLEIEWAGETSIDGCEEQCLYCRRERAGNEYIHGDRHGDAEHRKDCKLDALLIRLGLPDAASRDEARRLIAEADL